jgi:hypothetical protein
MSLQTTSIVILMKFSPVALIELAAVTDDTTSKGTSMCWFSWDEDPSHQLWRTATEDLAAENVASESAPGGSIPKCDDESGRT